MLFAISCFDKPGSLALRQATRPAHLDFVTGQHVVIGGPLLDAEGQPCGSLLLFEAPDRAADPYGLAGLFERVTIHGFRTVIRDGAPA